MVNHDDPCYLHSSEYPCVILISQSLTGDNSNLWCHVMLMALDSKNKIGFIDGSIPKP